MFAQPNVPAMQQGQAQNNPCDGVRDISVRVDLHVQYCDDRVFAIACAGDCAGAAAAAADASNTATKSSDDQDAVKRAQETAALCGSPGNLTAVNGTIHAMLLAVPGPSNCCTCTKTQLQCRIDQEQHTYHRCSTMPSSAPIADR